MRSLFETPPEHPFYRFWSTFGVHLGTLWNHFFNTFFDLIFRPPFEPQKKSDGLRSGSTVEPPSPGPLTLLTSFQEARNNVTSTADSESLSASRHTPGSTQGEPVLAKEREARRKLLCVCSVCVLLLSGLPGQEAKLNIKSTKNMSKNTTKIIDFRTQHRRFWDPF